MIDERPTFTIYEYSFLKRAIKNYMPLINEEIESMPIVVRKITKDLKEKSIKRLLDKIEQLTEPETF